MKLKFTYIDKIVNRIEIAYDGINFEDLGEITPAKKENLLAKGISLDDKKQLSGFDVNKIIIRANNGEVKKTHLKTAIEPDMLIFKASAVDAKYGYSSEYGAVKNYDINYVGNLSLLEGHYPELCYLLTGRVGAGKEPRDMDVKLYIDLPEYGYSFENPTLNILPNTSEKFLYMEINNINVDLPPYKEYSPTYGTPILGTNNLDNDTPQDVTPSSLEKVPGRSILITDNALFPGSGTPVVCTPKIDSKYSILSSNANLANYTPNEEGTYYNDQNIIRYNEKLPDYVLTYLPKADYIKPKNYTLTGMNCKYGYSSNGTQITTLDLDIRYSGNLSLLKQNNSLISYLFFGNTYYSESTSSSPSWGEYVFDTSLLPDNKEDFLYVETTEGKAASTGFGGTTHEDVYEDIWSAMNGSLPTQSTRNKRSILISNSLVRLSDGTVVNFSENESASIAGVTSPGTISTLNILNEARDIPM